MKLLCISDYKDSLIYSNNIKERFADIDIVLSSGDLSADYYSYIVSSLNKPLVFVFGNHNLECLKYFRKEYQDIQIGIGMETLCPNNKANFGGTYVGGMVKNVKGLLIGGVGGCMRYNRGLNQFTEVGMFFFMLKLIPKMLWNKIFYGRYLDVLLTHAPPRGIHDLEDQCHKGFKVFLWFMKVFKPKYLIHGHVHLYDSNKNRKTQYLDTTVINAYKHVVINF